MFFRLQKTILQMKDNRAAGEHEGGKGPARNQINSHQKRPSGLFDERSEIFCEVILHKKCGVKKREKVKSFFSLRRRS